MIRRSPRRNSTSVSNELVNDNELSLRARGLAVYLLSKPDSWRIDASALARTMLEGRHSILGALKELEIAGYLRRHREPDPGTGRWRSWSTLYETKDDAAQHDGEAGECPTEVRYPDVGNPNAGGPASGGPASGGPTSFSSAGEEIQRLAPAVAGAVDNDALRSAVITACRLDLERMTASASGALNKAVGDLAAAGARAGAVPGAAARFRSRFPSATLTPLALAKHWPQLGGSSASSTPSPSPAEKLGSVLALTITDPVEARRAAGDELHDPVDIDEAMAAWHRRRQSFSEMTG